MRVGRVGRVDRDSNGDDDDDEDTATFAPVRVAALEEPALDAIWPWVVFAGNAAPSLSRSQSSGVNGGA